MAIWEYGNFWVESRLDEYEDNTVHYILCDFNTEEESEHFSFDTEYQDEIEDRLDDNENPHDIFKDY